MSFKTFLGQAARLSAVSAAVVCSVSAHAAPNTLVGWAQMAAATFSDGPTSGQFAFTNANSPANNPPYVNAQPVQGFSGVLAGPNDSYHMLVDNGFGAKGNSQDSLLRMYGVNVNWANHSVSAANFNTGTSLPGYTDASRITLNDANRKLPFGIVADGATYPGSTIAVAPSITSGRLLTGGDLDLESVRRDKNGNLWFGEEFGPFLVKTDATGTVQSVFRTPNVLSQGSNPYVQSPSSPLSSGAVNLPGSGGFEGMALNASGSKLYTMLERPLTTDADQKRLLVQEFDLSSEAFTGDWFGYKLDAMGTNIGDMTAIDDNRFLVIERNGCTATNVATCGTPFKKIFMVDQSQRDADGFGLKTELMDLMNIADPNDLNGDGSTTFTFPYVTIEDVLLINPTTVLVVNDNNFPGGGGRNLASDPTEFLMINLANPVPEPESWAMALCGLGLLGRLACRKAE